MKKLLFLFLAVVFAWETSAAQDIKSSSPLVNQNLETVKFVTSDINLFWEAYDLARPENNINVFRDEYLRKGSTGLEEFRKLRIGSACNLVDAIENAPKY